MLSFLGNLGLTKKQSYMGDDSDAPDLGQPDYGMPSYDAGNAQPARPSFLQAFQAGAGAQMDPRRKLLGGLAGQAGAGGIRGAIGNIARFML